ncbi:hypothetical protein HK102_009534 [Quaeritorhiza haematococci]|nr:hypothetical protein HK102_009534 [Quaeritorhiza haematococci]
MATPLMSVVVYVLAFNSLCILFLSLPFHIRYRRSLIEFLSTSSALQKVRTGFGIAHTFVAILFLDNLYRLYSISETLTGAIESATSGAAGTGGKLDHDTLTDLFSRRFRSQRDFYILGFTLYTALVLYCLHLMVLRMGRYRKERDALKNKVGERDGGVPESVKTEKERKTE